MLIEACLEYLAEAIAAERVGADRIELCANLAAGGTSPSLDTVRAAVDRVRIPVVVMIRPRPGDFVYSFCEIDAMCREIDAARREGASGVVTGVLDRSGEIDAAALCRLVAAAQLLPVTFHRAFDAVPHHNAALECCIESGVARILTSGGAARAIDGIALLSQLQARAVGRIAVIAGGGVRADNVQHIIDQTGVREIHLGPRRICPRGTRQSTSPEHEFDDRALHDVIQRIRGPR